MLAASIISKPTSRPMAAQFIPDSAVTHLTHTSGAVPSGSGMITRET